MGGGSGPNLRCSGTAPSMKSLQTGAHSTPPVAPGIVTYLSGPFFFGRWTLAIQTTVVNSGVYPSNQQSRLSLVVPVLPCAFSTSCARYPVPYCTTAWNALDRKSV